MPIFNRLIFNKYSHAGSLCYGVLAPISRSYPPVEGRLHTCYSPVRRSPPSVLLPHVLPLDLHVLGLSLAFILSQDQTLRCIICCYERNLSFQPARHYLLLTLSIPKCWLFFFDLLFSYPVIFLTGTNCSSFKIPSSRRAIVILLVFYFTMYVNMLKIVSF